MALAVLSVIATFALGASQAMAAGTFGTSPVLDNFTTDTTLSPDWTTPALGEPAMELDTTGHDFTGTVDDWSAALWNETVYTNPVEVWSTISTAGTGDANLYADVTGGSSGTIHPTGAYFADFGGSASGGAPDSVSLWRTDGGTSPIELSFAPAPYTTDLAAGDSIGLSVSGGVVTAWYKPSGSSTWSAVVSAADSTYTSGNIAIEAIPASTYGFSDFGGGISTVSSLQTSTTLGPATSTITAGQQVTYTANVSPTPSPGGTVEFIDDATNAVLTGCGAEAVDVSGDATCSQTYDTPGTYAVDAIYVGDSDGSYAGSTNSGTGYATVVVNPAAATATATAIAASAASIKAGGSETYTATVSPAPTGGTVAFRDNGTAIGTCSAQPVNTTTGVATCTVGYPAPGSHPVSAAYSGYSTAFQSSNTTTPVTVTVTANATTTSIAASAAAITAGGQVTYSATVSPNPTSGTVAFKDNGTAISTCGAVTVNSIGQATCTVTYATAGSHAVSATYSGTANGAYATSSTTTNASVTVINTIVVTPPAATSITLASSSTTPLTGSAVTYSAKVNPAPNGGAVTFTDNGNQITGCTAVTPVNGVAACKVTYKTAGTHVIGGSYGGDASYATSKASKTLEITASSSPRLTVKTHELVLTPACPKGSSGCKISASVSVTVAGVKKSIALKSVTKSLKAGGTAQLGYTLSAKERSTLSSDIKSHKHGRITASVKLTIHDGNGSSGTQTISYKIGSAGDLTKS
jgi:hypothetical protein